MLPLLKTFLAPNTTFGKIGFIGVSALLATVLLSLTGIVTFSLAPLAYTALLARIVMPKNLAQEVSVPLTENITILLAWLIYGLPNVLRDNPSRTWQDIKYNFLNYSNPTLSGPAAKPIWQTLGIISFVNMGLIIGLLVLYPAPAVLLATLFVGNFLLGFLPWMAINLFPDYLLKNGVAAEFSVVFDKLLLALAIYAGITTLGISTATLLWAPWNFLPALWALSALTASPLLNGVIGTIGIAAVMLAANMAWSIVVKGFCAMRGIEIYQKQSASKKPLIKAVSLRLSEGDKTGLIMLTTDDAPPIIGSTSVECSQQNIFFELAADLERLKQQRYPLYLALFCEPMIERNRWSHTQTEDVCAEVPYTVEFQLVEVNDMPDALEQAMKIVKMPKKEIDFAVEKCTEKFMKLKSDLQPMSSSPGYQPAAGANVGNRAGLPQQGTEASVNGLLRRATLSSQ